MKKILGFILATIVGGAIAFLIGVVGVIFGGYIRRKGMENWPDLDISAREGASSIEAIADRVIADQEET